jgi:hypothetical protein
MAGAEFDKFFRQILVILAQQTSKRGPSSQKALLWMTAKGGARRLDRFAAEPNDWSAALRKKRRDADDQRGAQLQNYCPACQEELVVRG